MPKAGPSKAKVKGIPSFPKDFKVSGLSDLKVPDLKYHLNKARVTYKSDAVKAELLAVYVLFLIGIVAPKSKPDQELLNTVSGWCKDKSAALKEEVESKNLKCDKGSRWLYIQELVRYEVAEREEGEEENEDENDEVEPEEIPVKPKPEPKTKTKSKTAVAEAPDKEAPKMTKAGKRKRVNDEEDKPVAATKKAKGKDKVVEPAAEEETAAKEETKDTGIGKKAGTKGKEVATQAESAGDADDDDESSKAGAKGKEIATEEDESDIPVKCPTPAVMNLLIGTIFSALAKPDTTMDKVLTGCPVDTKEKVTNLLNTIRAFTDQEQLSELLKKPKSEAEKLLAWISTNYGTRIIEAEGDLKVPGFDGIPQFAIVKSHEPTLQKDWMNAYDKDGKKSVLLFHGTAFVHLRSILTNGFYPSQDKSRGVGICMAAEPSMSAGYASGPSKGYTTNSAGTVIMAKPLLYGGTWMYDPYNTRSLLLGCEATGTGRPQVMGVGEFHVITRLKSVLPRYIFLLPPVNTKVMQMMPPRAKVGPAMTEAFEKIRASIDEEE